jgi:hypothetical protein
MTLTKIRFAFGSRGGADFAAAAFGKRHNAGFLNPDRGAAKVILAHPIRRENVGSSRTAKSIAKFARFETREWQSLTIKKGVGP